MDSYNNAPNGSYNSYNSYTQQEEKAPNIFQQFGLAFVPPQYRRLAKVKTGSMIGFVTLLVLVFAICSVAKLAMSYISFGGVETLLEEVPNFSLKDGKFSIEEPWYLDEGSAFIYITDEYSEFTYDDIKDLVSEGYTDIILIAQKGVCYYSDREFQELNFADIKDFSLDKDWIVDTLVPIIWICIAVFYVIGFVCGTLWYFGCAAVYLLIAMLIALIMSKSIPAGKLFRAAVYAKVPMYVVAKVWGLLPLSLGGIPFLIRLVVTIVFLCFAIRSMDQKNTEVAPYGQY